MQTEQQTREEWLAGLKVGDEVAIPVAYSRNEYTLYKISHATKTRVTAGSDQFTRDDGRRWGGIKRQWEPTPVIEPVTEKVREALRRSSALERFKDLIRVPERFGTATLEAAIAVLKGEAAQ